MATAYERAKAERAKGTAKRAKAVTAKNRDADRRNPQGYFNRRRNR